MSRPFHDGFRRVRQEFLAFLPGRESCASVLIIRLMFVYFVQRRGLIDGEPSCTFYRRCLRQLFPEGLGFGSDGSAAEIDIPDAAFGRLFAFFDRFDWCLDPRTPAADNALTPDVIGHVLEKQANRRPTGTYYTGDDITEYIARSTIVPFLLDSAARACPRDFRPGGRVWSRLRKHADRYLFDTVRHGTDADLPAEIAAGLDDATRRDGWNRPAADGFGLPTETWREHVARRLQYHQLRQTLRAGQVSTVNDLVAHNLDLRQFTEDVLNTCNSPHLLRPFWAALQGISVLDPTCGAGAFLLATLNILEPLYSACLERMEALLAEKPHRAGLADFAAIVHRCGGRRGLVVKTIIANNLYGVDLMKEAAEVCKLRLRLRVVAEARTAADLEPLAERAFNIRVGNALVGHATLEEAARRLADPAPSGDTRPFHWFREFPEVMARGGFDVIIGNPPYVEYATVRKDYCVRNYATESCGNLYAFVAERSAALLQPQGRSGMIVPHSAFCTDRMAPMLDLFRGGRTTWVSTYDIRPAQLFPGVDQRLAIYLTAPSPREQRYATRYHRWHEPARPALFRALRYVDVSGIDYANSFAKAECAIELGLWKKLNGRSRLGDDLGGSAVVYYHNAPRYWVRALTFAPYFRNERDGEKVSAQVKRLAVTSRADAGVVVATLNSSLFYWWFILFSDSRHLNLREIERFPLGLAEMADEHRRELGGLCRRLMADYRRNAVRKTCRYKTTGRVVYDEYYPRHSKAIIDEIDRVLARHYGFTGEELDFVINYGVKYRVGDA